MNRVTLCRILVFLGFFAAALPGMGAQENDAPAAAPASPAADTDADADASALPQQFRELVLGMSLDDLKAALEQDNLFNFRGDRDVSFLPAREESLVETSGSSFVRRAFFQLRDGALFIMAFTLNTGMVDHYSVFTDLVAKYGQPESLNPQEAVWEDDSIRLSLERPLTVKYIDKKVFDDIISESTLIQSRRVQQFQEFLDEF